jgi:hypothetical protein
MKDTGNKNTTPKHDLAHVTEYNKEISTNNI